MSVLRLEHVGVVVGDLDEAVAFFADVGLELDGRMSVGGEEVDRIVGLEGVQNDVAMMRTPDGHGKLELISFHTPPSPAGDPHAPSNAPGLRHLLFAVDDIGATVARLQARGAELVGEVVDYGGSYRLCYIRGPEGIIVELAEKIA
jgi:catechol 2,3-dioxygenase-like lactoylglutathione lyase family enzyme